MKKIFAYILAVAAFASCSTDVNDVVTPSATLTAPMEVAVAESRAFDADLNWAWESTDVIAAYQNAGAKTINTLALNEAGNFYNGAFEYATQDLAAFHFVYPASQLASDYSLTAAQTGVWTPVLCGTVEAATVANLGTVELEYLSSAFEVRVWEAGREARKAITKAVLTSANDFVPTWYVNNDLTYTQSLSGKELSLNLNGDTAIFNLGEGAFDFTLTLTAASGETLSLPVSKSFVAGKRTILNVEWKSASATSWYEDYANNNGTALEGGAIYVTATGGTPVVTVDGVEVEVVDGKISGVATGSHNVVVTINGIELVNRAVVVTPIPTVSATVRTSYSDNGVANPTNNIGGLELQVSASLNETIPSNLISASQVVYGSTTSNITLGNTSKFTVSMGQYNCYAKVTLGNGYVCSTPSYATHVTGIPYTLNVTANDGTWTESGNVSWNENGGVRLGYYQWGDAASISRTFHIPANITVKVTSNGIVNGTQGLFGTAKVENTATVTVGSTTVVSKTQNGSSEASWSCSSASASMSSSSNTVKFNSSYNLQSAKVVVKALTIQY